jgi:murein DD-endopeptidase MepM/ murein hydrolase activator NlpD
MQRPKLAALTERLSYLFHPRHVVVHLAVVVIVAMLAFTAMFLPINNQAATTQSLDAPLPPRTISEIALDLNPLPVDESLASNNGVKPEITTSELMESWQTVSVKPGDTLSTIFQRLGIPARETHGLVSSSKQAKALAALKPGQQLAFQISEDKQLQKIKLIKNQLESTTFTKTASGYLYESLVRKPDIAFNFAKITIDSSLFQSANQAAIPDELTMELASVFGWDVDFALDIHKGDTFNFVYEELILDGKKIGHGDIVAAEFNKKDTSYQAVRYTDKDGNSRYFTPNGMSMRKEFLRTPIDFARISSHFNLKRKHPILHKIRAHKGTDYAADTGTPIKATGNGRVVLAGRKGGYGNTVIIRHGEIYETVYAHLSKYARGIKVGSKITQGQVIGYVGSSGLATGPHLHYEFHVNGQVRNPVTIKFANSSPIPTSEKPRFLAQTQRYMTQLASYTNKLTPTQIALSE